jgi:glucosyl-3-phosphoglycerate synthase
LVGPLLLDPGIKYVKAFYDRPITAPSGERVPGGGRVTEILVRPLFSLYFPELAAMIQPLSGEYAARRDALERIAFPAGYGVETSHLLDVYHTWGLDAIAQCDLGQRVHRNQDTQALGRMAFGILQTFFRRLESYGYARHLAAPFDILRQFQNVNGTYEQVHHVISEDERPPIIELEAYRQKFSRSL